MKKLIIVGSGMLGLNVLHLIRRAGTHEVVGFVDGGTSESEIFGVPVLGGDDRLPELVSEVSEAVIAIGSRKVRERLAGELAALGYTFPPVVSPLADVGLGADLGDGTILFAGVYVGPLARIGAFTVIESSASIAPAAEIEPYSLIHALTRVEAGA